MKRPRYRGRCRVCGKPCLSTQRIGWERDGLRWRPVHRSCEGKQPPSELNRAEGPRSPSQYLREVHNR